MDAVDRQREYRANNAEKLRVWQHEYYIENADRIKARQREYYRKNAEKLRVWQREYREGNPGVTQAQRRRNYAENKEMAAVQRREYKLRNLIGALLNSARYRAKQRGMEFNLSREDIVIPARCPVLGLEMTIGRSAGPRDTSPTLDRIDNAKGYIKGNVVVVSFRANRLKGDATLAEIRAIGAFYGQ